MRIGAVFMLLVALVLGGASVFVARGWIERQIQGAASQKQQMEVTTVVVARTQLNFGDRIQSEHLKEVTWPTASVPQGAFKNRAELLKSNSPRVALRRIETDEPILKSKISGFGGRASLSSVMEGDSRAITIRVNDITGVAGFLLPGDRVDILLTRQSGENPVNSILLQNVRILGVGQIASESRDKPVVVRAVTVEATPIEAQKLTLAQRIGQLQLVLRPVTDRDIAASRTVNIADLIGPQSDPARLNPPPKADEKKTVRKPVISKPKPDPFTTVRIIRGLSSSSQRVPREAASPVATPPSAPAATAPTSLVPQSEGGPEGDQEQKEGTTVSPAGATGDSAPGPESTAPAPAEVEVFKPETVMPSGEGTDTTETPAASPTREKAEAAPSGSGAGEGQGSGDRTGQEVAN